MFLESFSMKAIRTSSSRVLLRISQQEWRQIGEDAHFFDDPEPQVAPVQPERVERIKHIEALPEPEPLPETMDVTVGNYGETRMFAVHVNGELLCVTAYRKGAAAVKELVDRLWAQIEGLSTEGATI